MGKVNQAMHHYMRDKGRFADLFNGVFFQGRKILCATDLTEASEQYSEAWKDNRDRKQSRRLERTRDIKMRLQTSEGVLRLLALENQNLTDYGMPFRCMQYDAMEYQKQLEELKNKNREAKDFATPAERICGLRKTDRLTPVYTLCLYHGEEEWDGPKCLKDMMAFAEDDEMEAFFADYPMRLFYVKEETDCSVFRTELREVLEALKYRRNKGKLRRIMTETEAYRHLSEDTVEVLSVLLDAPGIWEKRSLYRNEESDREEYDMCQAMREMLMDERIEGRSEGRNEGREEGRNEGREEGRNEGREEGIRVLIKMCRKFGKSYEEAKESVAEGFGLGEADAQNSMIKYWKE